MCDTSLVSPTVGMDLYWLPLGAGGHFVRWNGRIYEAVSALLERRGAADLYHSALQVRLPPASYVIEVTPVWNLPPGDRGVIAEGAVGPRWAGRGSFDTRSTPGAKERSRTSLRLSQAQSGLPRTKSHVPALAGRAPDGSDAGLGPGRVARR